MLGKAVRFRGEVGLKFDMRGNACALFNTSGGGRGRDMDGTKPESNSGLGSHDFARFEGELWSTRYRDADGGDDERGGRVGAVFGLFELASLSSDHKRLWPSLSNWGDALALTLTACFNSDMSGLFVERSWLNFEFATRHIISSFRVKPRKKQESKTLSTNSSRGQPSKKEGASEADNGGDESFY